MKEISTKKFPKIVRELIKENDLMPFEVENLPKKIAGFTKSEFLFINSEKDFYTKRFTLCHELGHNVLNHKFKILKEEKEADNFACDILIDEKDFKEKVEVYQWSAFDLQTYFGVPFLEIKKFAQSRFGRCF